MTMLRTFPTCRSLRIAAAAQRNAAAGGAKAAKKTMVLQPAPGAPPG
jgi:hypothetical protein